MMKSEFDDKDHTLSAIGGVETGGDAAEFILLGADTVQVQLGISYCYISLECLFCKSSPPFHSV